MQQEEALLTELITKYEHTRSNWVPDVVGRAYGNRGNARSRQGKLIQSLEDYNTAIRICPWSGDPVLNRYCAVVTDGHTVMYKQPSTNLPMYKQQTAMWL